MAVNVADVMDEETEGNVKELFFYPPTASKLKLIFGYYCTLGSRANAMSFTVFKSFFKATKAEVKAQQLQSIFTISNKIKDVHKVKQEENEKTLDHWNFVECIIRLALSGYKGEKKTERIENFLMECVLPCVISILFLFSPFLLGGFTRFVQASRQYQQV